MERDGVGLNTRDRYRVAAGARRRWWWCVIRAAMASTRATLRTWSGCPVIKGLEQSRTRAATPLHTASTRPEVILNLTPDHTPHSLYSAGSEWAHIPNQFRSRG